MPNILILFCIIILLLLLLNLCVWNICRQNYLNAKNLYEIKSAVAQLCEFQVTTTTVLNNICKYLCKTNGDKQDEL